MKSFLKITILGILSIVFIENMQSCKKLTVPAVSTVSPSVITQTSAVSGGNVSDDGGAEVTSRGICWGTTQNPTTSSNMTSNGTGTGTYTSTLTGLNANTRYYVRAYATNSEGTSYGNEVSFDTSPVGLATLTTYNTTSVESTTAVSGGNITFDGGASITARGVCWAITPNPTILDNKTNDGSGTGSFASNITGLSPTTTYYLRAYATNSAGTAYGNEVTFNTTGYLATIRTYNVDHISQWSAFVNNEITWDGGAEVTSRGVCWSTDQNPTTADTKTNDGSGTGYFVSSLINLNAGTTYYIRAYCTNSAGTTYGDQVTFATLTGGAVVLNPNLIYGSITDIEGNVYKTIQIGTQVWMAENLRTTKLNDNTNILLLTNDTEWSNISSPGYCWYGNNSEVFKAEYGAIYNFYSVLTGKICPVGWHIPSSAEWSTLTTYSGGENAAGIKLKESGNTHWESASTGATNESGFTAIPGGQRQYNGTFWMVGERALWWGSDRDWQYGFGWQVFVNYSIAQGLYYNDGVYIRCIMD